MNGTRIRAMLRKDLREFGRNRSIVTTMAILPLVFAVTPLAAILALPESASGEVRSGHIMLALLGIAAVAPAVVASYAVVGERLQGSLEPVLTTPIPGGELLLAKALAAMVPTLGVAYVVFAFVVALIATVANPAIAAAVIQPVDIAVQLIFTPLIAGWSIWLGIAISTRVSDARAAQQIGTLASVPTAIVAELAAFNIIHPTDQLAVFFAVLLVALNVLGWRITTALFDRERLIAGSR
jgi:ABC-type Na+ efflux pump permease subunit